MKEKHIRIEGDLSRRRLSYIKDQLTNELFNLHLLHITITEVTSLDLFTIQWIHAFGCAAATEGKEVIITMNLPSQYDALVRMSGIEKMYNRFEQPEA